MAPTARQINTAAHKVLKKEGHEHNRPPSDGMPRSLLMQDVFAKLRTSPSADVRDTTLDDIVEMVGILLFRYHALVENGEKSAIRRVPNRPLRVWLKSGEKNANPKMDDL